MVVELYPISLTREIWSFREQPNASPVQVRVPAGSKLKLVKSVGLVLFVPHATDKLFVGGWQANQTIAEARREGGRFRLVNPSKLAGAAG